MTTQWWSVEVRNNFGEWVLHSRWLLKRDAQDQADLVHGRVVRVNQ